MGTYGSRSGAVGMSALVKALDKVEAKAKKVAAHLLEAAEGDIEFKDGNFSVAGTDKSVPWGGVALNAYIAHKFNGQELEPGLKETSFYDPTNFTFPAGCHICEVEVDPETGNAEIVGWTAVDDFGVIINPMIVEGQIHGGVAQGIGQALCEGAVYDQEGQLVTGSLMDYCMPRADHLPSITVGTTLTKCPSNPLGIKGCGEAGAIASPAAVINAITNAVGVYQGQASAVSRRRAARRAERGPAAAGLRGLAADARPGRQPRLRRAHRHARRPGAASTPPTRACCWRRTFRCCSWARSSRRRRRSPISATSATSLPRRDARPARGVRTLRGLRRCGRARAHSRPERAVDLRGVAPRWRECAGPRHAGRRPKIGELLVLRRQHLAPHLGGTCAAARRDCKARCCRSRGSLGDAARWQLLANFGADAVDSAPATGGAVVYGRAPRTRRPPGASARPGRRLRHAGAGAPCADDRTALERLCRHFGIATDYHDIWSVRHDVADRESASRCSPTFDVDASSDLAVATAERAADGRVVARSAAAGRGDRRRRSRTLRSRCAVVGSAPTHGASSKKAAAATRHAR